jgi:hypothetical protein
VGIGPSRAGKAIQGNGDTKRRLITSWIGPGIPRHLGGQSVRFVANWAAQIRSRHAPELSEISYGWPCAL